MFASQGRRFVRGQSPVARCIHKVLSGAVAMLVMVLGLGMVSPTVTYATDSSDQLTEKSTTQVDPPKAEQAAEASKTEPSPTETATPQPEATEKVAKKVSVNTNTDDDPIISIVVSWITSLKPGVTKPKDGGDVTFPQDFLAKDTSLNYTAEKCGVWVQNDLYKGKKSVIYALWADGKLTKAESGQIEDANVVKEWNFTYSGDCVTKVTVAEPKFTPGTCTALGSVDAVDTADYTWSHITDGNKVTYTAKATSKNIELTGKTSWTYDLSKKSGEQCDNTDLKKVKLCHATASETNPYTSIEVSVAAFFKDDGHINHAGDIWAAFTYVKNGETIPVPEQGDQALLAHDCQLPVEVTPAAPKFTPGTCTALGTATAVDTEQYAWARAEDGNKVTFTASPIGYVKLTGQTVYTFDLSKDPTNCPTNQCTAGKGDLSTNVNPTWGNVDTRANGHYAYVSGGLHVWTTDNSSQAKVSLGHAANFDLKNTGVLDLEWTGSTPPPGINLFVNFDGTYTGTLVYESVYGQDLWLTNGSSQYIKDNAPVNGGGNGSQWHGTIDQWLTVFPDAKVTGIAFSLGSGVLGDGTIKSITVNCAKYAFDVVKPTVSLIAGDQKCVPSNESGHEGSPVYTGGTLTVTPDGAKVYKSDDIGGTALSSLTDVVPGSYTAVLEWKNGTETMTVQSDAVTVKAAEDCTVAGQLDYTVVCDKLTVNPPTGVKPAESTVVVKLDGTPIAVGDTTVGLGEHTLTMEVNGIQTDSETFTVVACVANDAKGSFTLTGKCGLNNDGIEYAVKHATHGAPVWQDGKVSVTFTADAGYANADGELTWTVTKNEVNTTTSCGGLAYTGADPWGLLTLAGMFMLIGVPLIKKFSFKG